MEKKDLMILHAYGESVFNSDEIRGYGSLEALMESDILQGVPNREKSLTQLWEAAQMLANMPEPASQMLANMPEPASQDEPQTESADAEEGGDDE